MEPKNEITKHIGRRIYECRKAINMTQAELAACTGLTRTSITNIESGYQELPITQLYNVAKVLNVEVSDLLPEFKITEHDREQIHNSRKEFRKQQLEKQLDKTNQKIVDLLERHSQLNEQWD